MKKKSQDQQDSHKKRNPKAKGLKRSAKRRSKKTVSAEPDSETLTRWKADLEVLAWDSQASVLMLSMVYSGYRKVSVVCHPEHPDVTMFCKEGDVLQLSSRSCGGQIVARSLPLYVENMMESDKWCDSEGLKHEMKSFFGVPIRNVEGDTCAILCAYSSRACGFSKEGRELVEERGARLEHELQMNYQLRSLAHQLENQKELSTKLQHEVLETKAELSQMEQRMERAVASGNRM